MEHENIINQRKKLANSLTAVAAGMLTDIIFDELTEADFTGKVENGEITLWGIDKFTFPTKVLIILGIFLGLWILFSYVIPVVGHFMKMQFAQNIPKISKNKILSTYKECKTSIDLLQEKVYNKNSAENSIILFSEICFEIEKLHKVFCSKKQLNKNRVKNMFRTGSSIHDISRRISPYEYLAVINALDKLCQVTYSMCSKPVDRMIDSDYKRTTQLLSNLRNILKVCCVEELDA